MVDARALCFMDNVGRKPLCLVPVDEARPANKTSLLAIPPSPSLMDNLLEEIGLESSELSNTVLVILLKKYPAKKQF